MNLMWPKAAQNLLLPFIRTLRFLYTKFAILKFVNLTHFKLGWRVSDYQAFTVVNLIIMPLLVPTKVEQWVQGQKIPYLYFQETHKCNLLMSG